ncbi:hypothetical protein Y71_13030 [Kosakonia radicincitans DSM 16656]|mgnify:CR=1 FL=1|uniref:Bacteriocin-type signal sequence-containing protein n=1 Tax=Kosakonia radicincitans TaxID=283686 RepID=A0AAX2EP91_9ENTR|nr:MULTISPECIES: hypothetical protein [Kosakonia]MDP9566945.1 hypothetical protein [Kosakonia oryzae]APG18116.1 hypothetical protein A3780_11325 [Kosakonia radicincitans]ARD60798.1 hypothetical protein Y71_13030 [Kosakonia radicincitans DSM 16656]KDE38141.1 hypothetical protein AW40_01300 [Kosakonia radicincitans UMEnt01/12]MDD7998087.1 hypothetical protein [Kosakonia radicincitans]
MKELNNNEMMAVSGAGFLSDTAGMIGGSLGGLVDAILGGDKTTFADMGRKTCQAVAGFIESGFGIIKNLFGGLFGSKA